MKVYERLNRALRKMESDPSVLLRDVLNAERDRQDGALFELMLKGILENRVLLDALLGVLSSLPLNKYRREEYYYLLIGAYGVMYLDKPDYAVVNEIVQLMKKRSPHRTPAANAILRRLGREKNSLLKDVFSGKTFSERLSLSYSVHPELTDILLEQYSVDEVEAYFRFAQKKPFLDLCVIRKDREEYGEELFRLGYRSENLPGTHAGLRISGDLPSIDSLPGFQEGSVYIMGQASQMLCEWIPDSDNLLDLCAAPGGKSICIKNRLSGIRLSACDISEERLQILRQNLKRVRMDADILQLDALQDHPPFHDKFDAVLLDAPCTSSGLLQRHPDLRHLITRERLESAAVIQRNLLRRAQKYVKKQGFLIYSTCSILKQEGSLQIESFLRAHNSFCLCKPSVTTKSDSEKYFQTFPWVDGCDGFFAAVMQRME